jgi:hypothetical protein
VTDLMVDHGVLTGCQVAAQSSPDGTVQIAAGSVLNANITGPVAAVSSFDILGGHPADATNDRFDVISVDNTGTPNLTVGTPATPPAEPDTSDVPAANVYIYSQASPSHTGTITAGVIQDVRRFVRLPLPANLMAYTFLSGSQSNTDPGTGKLGFDTTNVTTIAHLYLNYLSPTTGASIKTWLGAGGGGTSGTGSMPLPYYLRLYSRANPANMMLLEVTSLSDHGPLVYNDLGVSVVYSSSGSTGPPLTTTAQDTVVEWDGTVAPSIPTASNGNGSLSGDVAMTTANTFYDGPNTGSIGAASEVLLLIGQVTVVGGCRRHQQGDRPIDGRDDRFQRRRGDRDRLVPDQHQPVRDRQSVRGGDVQDHRDLDAEQRDDETRPGRQLKRRPCSDCHRLGEAVLAWRNGSPPTPGSASLRSPGR